MASLTVKGWCKYGLGHCIGGMHFGDGTLGDINKF